MKRVRHAAAAGFTLIELAIVMVIVTILIGGLAVPLSAQIEARRIAETRKTLDEARESLVGYALSHATNVACKCTYIPNPVAGNPPLATAVPQACLSFCPVSTTNTDTVNGDLTLSTRHYLPCPDTDGDGRENRTGSACTSPYGLFPWVDLGTAAQDAWGNRLYYSVTPWYADSSIGFPSATGSKQVCSSSVGSCASGTVAANVPVVIVSYGPNGWGARNVSGSTLAAPTSADELDNTDNDNAFVSREPSKAGTPNGEFDDLVVWISDPLLVSRVCPAGGCP
jgi:prepilin-type N-terminal cleavage/methylation domain-containing protein